MASTGQVIANSSLGSSGTSLSALVSALPVPVLQNAGLLLTMLMVGGLTWSFRSYFRKANPHFLTAGLFFALMAVGGAVLAINPLALSPSTLSFVAESQQQTVQLNNNSNSAANNLVITTTGPFIQTNNCGSNLQASASCNILVTYRGNLCQNCSTGLCINGACAVASCSDNIKDGNETDVDCGGAACSACSLNRSCLVNSDCASNACDPGAHVCVAALCTDGVQDGRETDVDCGGGTCSACSTGRACGVDSDCASNACDALSQLCVSSQCSDHRKDGNETDVDCGGNSCGACGTGLSCAVNSDCQSNACDASSHVCVASQCTDHRKDGSETDVDCGGNSCGACNTGLSCAVNSDCQSNACDALSHVCVVSQCNDQQRDGNETDVDCGGSSCAACSAGRACAAGADCLSGSCNMGVCQ